jgi:hypothetical protein
MVQSVEQAIESIANNIARKNRQIASLEDKIEWLEVHAVREYERGVEEGGSCQAIVEIQGRERFLEGLKEEGCPGCPRSKAAEAAGGE